MKIMNSWEEILQDMSNSIIGIMDTDVFYAVAKELLHNINIEFYHSGHDPIPKGWVGKKTYKRRKALLNRDSVYHEVRIDRYGGVELFVTSDASAGASIITNRDTGEKYTWDVQPGEHGNFLYMMSENNALDSDSLNLGFLNKTRAWRGIRYPVEITQDQVMDELSTGSGLVGRAFMRGMRQHFGG